MYSFIRFVIDNKILQFKKKYMSLCQINYIREDFES